MAINNDPKIPNTVPITVLPPGRGNQIDRMREWDNAERNRPRGKRCPVPALVLDQFAASTVA